MDCVSCNGPIIRRPSPGRFHCSTPSLASRIFVIVKQEKGWCWASTAFQSATGAAVCEFAAAIHPIGQPSPRQKAFFPSWPEETVLDPLCTSQQAIHRGLDIRRAVFNHVDMCMT
ncbi:hypothetical protein MY1884_001806 [Beauveria asiatica]